MQNQVSHVEHRRRRLLNGWWDFLPVEHADLTHPLEPEAVPSEGWTERAYLVPGFFTDHPYPQAWRQGRGGWARTSFVVSELRADERAYLTVKAAIPQAWIFVNGQKLATQEDMFIGDELDVTDALHSGDNELAVFLTEFETFPHPDSGEVKLIGVPWGCCIAQRQAGIWQDVELEWRLAVYVSDLTIVTSVREDCLTVDCEITNLSCERFEGMLSTRVYDGDRCELEMPDQVVRIAPGERQVLTLTAKWHDYRPWCSADPHLYHLATELIYGNMCVDTLITRFGFREIWIEGHRILLNGVPQRWYGEWCHKAHTHWLRPEYVRQWYRQLRDCNMNYVRMHTFPHPEYFLDIADEMGILVCQETALYGSFEGALDTPHLWPSAADHVQRMVQRDKNHPSLVIWSVENEMRWALKTMPKAKQELPLLRSLFNRLDPTRPAFHEGDSGIWNEKQQPIISRHYGPACHGWGWWDRTQPLHAGEMGRWHYGSPYVALQWAGDEVFSDYTQMSQSIARDAARIIELGRANEVSCLFVWNTSGLDNYRSAEGRTFEWPDPNAPYAKPLAHLPYESEYAWWADGAGYRPGPSFEVVKHAQRPLAIVVWEERSQFYADRDMSHTVFLVSDLTELVSGEMCVWLEHNGSTIWKDIQAMAVRPGSSHRYTWRVPLSGLPKDGEAVLVTRFESPQGCDEVRRTLHVEGPERRTERLVLPTIAIWGNSRVEDWLVGHGVEVIAVGPDDELDPSRVSVVIFGERAVEPGSDTNRLLHDYVERGGRLLVLEQTHSLFPGLEMARMPIEMAHIRDPDHPVLDGITNEDLRFFGDEPFGMPSSDSWVTLYPYVKPQGEHLVRSIVDSSGGDFGTGGLTWAPVIEAQIGQGLVVASQLRLIDRLEEIPIANRLLSNALRYLAYAPAPGQGQAAITAQLYSLWPEGLAADRTVQLDEGQRPMEGIALLSGEHVPSLPVDAWKTYLQDGNTIVLCNLCPETIDYWQTVTGCAIMLFEPEYDIYQLVRAASSPLLNGISNEDTCWLENWQYRRNPTKERIADWLVVVDGGTNLLENATRSVLDVLYGDGKASEVDRMPTVSAYIDQDPPRVGGGLVQIPVEGGQVLISQIHWRPEKFQFRRFLGLLLWNLGIATGSDVLAGAHTPMTGKRSDGYPEEMRVVRNIAPDTLEELLQLCARQVEYCSDNATFRLWPQWTLVNTPGGRIDASELEGAGMIYVGLEVNSAQPRKLVATVGGLPNPDLQTFLRLSGGGRVQVWVNGKVRGAVRISEEHLADIADIDLEAGGNLVLLQWDPDGSTASLELRFENKDRQPEITFQFV